VEGMSYHFGNKTNDFENFEILVDKNFVSDQKSSFLNLGKKILGIKKNVPTHIAVIPDGNRRWAKQKGLDELEGHRVGGVPDKMKSLLSEAQNLGTKYFTIWVFSTENWKRSQRELDSLFEIIYNLLSKLEVDFIKEKIRFRHFGRKDRLPKNLIEITEHLEKITRNFKNFNFQLCMDYGGRDEIVRAVNKALKNGSAEIVEEDFANYLDSCGIPDPDLIIRTSGEYRLSGFMPFQSTYSEFYFTDVHFPDFGSVQLREAVESFDKRKRKFGGN
jgi:undecaprenyl diphosphate synthase